MISQLQLAEAIALFAHYRQREESTGDDYICHIRRVVNLVDGEDTKTVAWLHDVVEDSEPFMDDPEEKLKLLGFTGPVVDAVLVLTRGWHRPKSESYERYIADIVGSNDTLALDVKIADLQDHLRPNCPETLRPRYERALKALLQVRQDRCALPTSQ